MDFPLFFFNLKHNQAIGQGRGPINNEDGDDNYDDEDDDDDYDDVDNDYDVFY